MPNPTDILLATYYDSVYSYSDNRLVLDYLKKCGGPLVDLGCATGRVLRFALEQGFQAIGIDHSPEMIRVAQERLLPLFGQKLRTIQGNFIDLPIQENVGVITCLANTYSMILQKSDRLALLTKVKEHLRPESCFIIWIMNDHDTQGQFFTKEIQTNKGLLDFRLDWKENRAQRTRTFQMKITLGSQEENHVFPTRLLSINEMQDEILMTGLKLHALYSDFNGTPFTEGSQRQVYIIGR